MQAVESTLYKYIVNTIAERDLVVDMVAGDIVFVKEERIAYIYHNMQWLECFNQDYQYIVLRNNQRTNSFTLQRNNRSFTILNSSVFSTGKFNIRKSILNLTSAVVPTQREVFVGSEYPVVVSLDTATESDKKDISWQNFGDDACRFEVVDGDNATIIKIAGFKLFDECRGILNI